MSAPSWLAEAQARIRALVTAPEGVAAALRESADPDGRELQRLVRSDATLSASDRLGVYSNAFFERLRGALAKDFPDLARAFGDDVFHDVVRVYLLLHPPHRPSIRHAGAQLAAFLRDEEVAAPFRRRLPCAADLAAFEWAQTDAFDAHDATPLAADELAALPADRWPMLQLRAAPSLRTLRTAWPVQRLSDSAGPAEAVALAPESTFLRIWRLAERVRWREISAAEHAALVLLEQGACFAAVCEEVGQALDEEAATREAARLLATWIAEGCLASTADS